MIVYRLTTIDNEFDPFDDFINWNQRDVELGYNTCSKIARRFKESSSLSDQENMKQFELIIDQMVSEDPLQLYIKVSRNVS